jgi:NAD(P)-dependent dehydrogenase (short-subunit alcohol dehydrogenase family)
MATPELRTPQGWELQFATNHLGHFALAAGLHDALSQAGHARRYFEDCQEAVPCTPGVRRGVAPYALDPQKAQLLWQVSHDRLAQAERRDRKKDRA